MPFQLIPGQILVDVLPQVEGGDDVEPQADHNPQRPEPDDRAAELVAVAGPGDRDDVAIGGDKVHAGYGGRQAAVGISSAMRPCGARASDADVREGAEVAQRVARAVQVASQLPVGGTRADLDHGPLGIDGHVIAKPGQRNQITRRIRDRAERVAGAKRPHSRAPANQALQVRDAGWAVQPPRAEDDVPGPIGRPLAQWPARSLKDASGL